MPIEKTPFRQYDPNSDPKIKPLVIRLNDKEREMLDIAMYAFNNHSQGGTFSRLSSNIEIGTENRLPMDILETAKHEVGHYVYYDYLSSNDRDDYDRLFSNATIFVSDYSRTKASEDFAESFQAAIHCYYDPAALPRDRQIFFDKKVKEALE